MACKDQGIPATTRAYQGMGIGYAPQTAAPAICAATRLRPRWRATCSGPSTVVDPLAWEGRAT